MVQVVTYPAAEDMPDILETFQKENTNLHIVIKYLSNLLNEDVHKHDKNLKNGIDKLTSVSNELNKIFQLSPEYVKTEYSEIFKQLKKLTQEIWSVADELDNSKYSPPAGQPNLFFIKNALRSCVEGDDVFYKMIGQAFSDITKPRYH